jgi:multicomponent Na+:H+ antiporter subunit E
MLLWNVLLALIWGALQGEFSLVNLLTGFALAYVVLWISQPVIGRSSYFHKVRQTLGFLLFFLRELVKANLVMAHDMVTPTHHMHPGVVAIPLEAKTDTEITMLANLITLTPGTLSLDVSTDRRTLYVHAMYLGDLSEFRRELKEGMERRLLEVMR